MSAERTNLSRLKAIVGGSIGNLVEWYDWYTYSAATLYFAPLFFPKGDQTAQLLQAAAIFAAGFAARPIGAWLMGLYADRADRGNQARGPRVEGNGVFDVEIALALTFESLNLGAAEKVGIPATEELGQHTAFNHLFESKQLFLYKKLPKLCLLLIGESRILIGKSCI
jgi:hypothetical protein